jgi:hypothetical protein
MKYHFLIHPRITLYDSVRISVLSQQAAKLRARISNGHDYGSGSFKGMLKGLRIWVNENRITIEGSLAKYYFGDNFRTLSLGDARDCIKRLSEELGIDILSGKVTKLEFGTSIVTNHSAAEIISSLRSLPRTKTLVVYDSDGVAFTKYFKTDVWQAVFYDKSAEAKGQRCRLPKEFEGRNVLRYELKFKKYITRQLKMESLTVADLVEEAFFLKLLTIWRDTYYRIKKRRIPVIDPEIPLAGIKALDECLKVCALQNPDVSRAIALKVNRCTDKQMKSRMKKALDTAQGSPKFTRDSEAIEEMNRCVEDTYTQYSSIK